MHYKSAQIKLPYVFQSTKIIDELEAIQGPWQAHPSTATGNFVLPLIAPEQDPVVNSQRGKMARTPYLDALPTVVQLLAQLNIVTGRCYAHKIEAHCETNKTINSGYYWREHAHLQIGIKNTAPCTFLCSGKNSPRHDGEIWLIDTWSGFQIINPSEQAAYVLICETVGSSAFWSIVDESFKRIDSKQSQQLSPRKLTTKMDKPFELSIEGSNFPVVMSPWEFKSLSDELLAELATVNSNDQKIIDKFTLMLSAFFEQWKGLWAAHGELKSGWVLYRQAVEQLFANVNHLKGSLKFANGLDASIGINSIITEAALNTDLATGENQRQSQPPENTQPPTVTKEDKAQQKQAQTEQEEKLNQEQEALRSVHTPSFPQLLAHLQSSLAVSTYQAGKLMLLRSDQGLLNTHFKMLPKPMGLCSDGQRLAIGTTMAVEEYYDMPQVAAKLPDKKHDHCYLPRSVHVTGNIDIHEMSWGTDELWVVNTRFSCLCTLDSSSSFVPRWRPHFISALAAEDRCHLNGLEMRNGKPKWVTALGESDEAGGWRKNKASGGLLIDVDSNEIISRGLSMPHSPRYYNGKLWLLESGNGSLATVNLKTGELETVCLLPGFTRGLSFYQQWAFIGLSQVRESAVFSGLAITERVSERNSGVWVVDIIQEISSDLLNLKLPFKKYLQSKSLKTKNSLNFFKQMMS